MHDSLKRRHTLTVPVQRADSHKQVEEVGCPPESWCPMEPKLPGQLRACQAACTAIVDRVMKRCLALGCQERIQEVFKMTA